MIEDEREVIVEWKGPYSSKEVHTLTNGKTDRGLYQVYAHHPVYGAGQLVYIGITTRDSFAKRIRDRFVVGSENDAQNVQHYIGRVKYEHDETEERWERDVQFAEKLLIHAHGVAYNSTHIEAVNEGKDKEDKEVQKIRVLNFGAVRALHREVSGLVWTTASRKFNDYRVHGS
ncbi:MAG TPA: hypothetical protein VJO12_03580 [Stellaceae bacterium]|nr:hypothetical protein [Stellaceae bacterium]